MQCCLINNTLVYDEIKAILQFSIDLTGGKILCSVTFTCVKQPVIKVRLDTLEFLST